MRTEEAMAVLVSVKSIGYSRREAALRRGNAEEILSDPDAFRKELGPEGVSAVRAAVQAMDETLGHLRETETHLLVRGDPCYPPRLLLTERPPHLLYVRGRQDLSDRVSAAVVGARRADPYGLFYAKKFACQMAEAGICIVSGLALGIDAEGHKGALDAGGRTAAVLGGGLDRFFPEENRPLMERILENGGSILSEYPPDVPAGGDRFLERNRIIAGMCQAVFVAQGGRRSGASRTAGEALDAGRIVFALPGDIDRANSELPNRLISEGAVPVTKIDDIISELSSSVPELRDWKPEKSTAAGRSRTRKAEAPAAQPEKAAKGAAKTMRMPEGLGEQEKKIFLCLAESAKEFDALSDSTGIGAEELGAVLAMMEMDGLVRPAGGTGWALEE